MKKNLISAILMASFLAGCVGGVAQLPATSRTASVTGGFVDETLSDEQNQTISEVSVGTVAYVTGIDADRGQMVASVGISGTPTVGAARTSGSGTYSTTYSYGVIDGITRTSSRISGYRGGESGTMTLSADFDTGILQGSSSELTVDGGVAGSTVSGIVTANYSYPGASGSVSGTLNGQIGATGIIATFHGHDENTVMAGGLVGTSP